MLLFLFVYVLVYVFLFIYVFHTPGYINLILCIKYIDFCDEFSAQGRSTAVPTMEQVEGSSHPMERDRELTKQVETGEASGSSYEQEASEDMKPLEVRNTRRELARDPDYNREADEVN